jgi:hypothetical protein
MCKVDYRTAAMKFGLTSEKTAYPDAIIQEKRGKPLACQDLNEANFTQLSRSIPWQLNKNSPNF